MGQGEGQISPAEQDILVWAILCVFVSFCVGGCQFIAKCAFLSMKWLFIASETATSAKVEFCIGLSWGPYKEAIFPRFRNMARTNRFS